MSDPNIKLKVTADASQARKAIRLTREELEKLSRSTAQSNAAAQSGRGAWAAYTGTMNLATRAVRGFFSAFGLIGAVMSGIRLAISLWEKLKEKLEAQERAAKAAAEKLADARKKVEELNQARLDRAQKAMRAFADEVARARDNANALSSAIGNLASAQADFDASQIDLAVARGEMSKEAGDKKKADIAVDAAFAAREADTDKKLETKSWAQVVFDSLKADLERQTNAVFDEHGHVDTTQNDLYEKYSAAKTQANIFKGFSDEGKYKHEEEIARQNWVAFLDTAREYEKALSALEVATKEYDAALLQGDAAINRAVAAQERQAAELDKATQEAHEKSARELAKANVDWEVQQGGKSAKAGELEKRRIDLEAERDAIQKAIFDRSLEDQKEGRDPKTDNVLDTLWNNLNTVDRNLEIVDDQARKEEEGGGEEKNKAPEMVRPSVDAWTRIGAFAGNGAQSETINLQRGSFNALKAIQKSSERMQQALLIMKPLTL